MHWFVHLQDGYKYLFAVYHFRPKPSHRKVKNNNVIFFFLLARSSRKKIMRANKILRFTFGRLKSEKKNSQGFHRTETLNQHIFFRFFFRIFICQVWIHNFNYFHFVWTEAEVIFSATVKLDTD